MKNAAEILDEEPEASKVFSHPSPNFDERAPEAPLQYIVLHYTGMLSRDEALRRLCDPASKVSSHYLIDEEGRAFALVDEAKRAWHAGKSFWRGATDLNSASIGIELANPGHAHGYAYFPPAQIKALTDLLMDIVARHKFEGETCLLAHSDIAPGRKEDPGEYFPWGALAAQGLGVLPQTRTEDYAAIADFEEQKLLRTIGYDCPESNLYDTPTRAALLAFQRRYEPENMTGTPERETIARLRAMARAFSRI